MSVFDKVKKIIVDELAVEEDDVVPEAHLMDDLDADSMNLLVIYSEVEKLFNIKIDDKKALGIRTVDDLLNVMSELGV